MSWLGWLVVAGVGLGVAGLSWFSVQLLTQQGRLLLRIERLEASLAEAGIPLSAAMDGVAPGTQLDLELPDLDGQRHTLHEHSGRRVLLVNWAPDCSFCDMVAPDLAEAQPLLRARQVDVVLVSRGDREANTDLLEHHALAAPVLLADEPVEGFAGVGTPAAYLLDEHGAVASPLVVGADNVAELAREVTGRKRRLATEKPLTESKLERNGIPPGTPAPAFTLPDLDGGQVALDDHAGKRRLVVFSDPHCEPCMELAPSLARAARAGVPAIVMVSRGDPAENREKRDRFALAFPIGLQRSWEVSRQYGIFSTPVAFLVDEEGVIAQPVAIGPDAIIHLIDQERHQPEREVAIEVR